MGRNVATKVDGIDALPAAEFNDWQDEAENFVLTGGIALSSGDLFQMSRSAAQFAGDADHWVDSGVADAYILGVAGPRLKPPALTNGLRVRFEVGFTNTGASTINVGSFGVKAILKSGAGTNIALTGGELVGGNHVELLFDSGDDAWVLTSDGALTAAGPSSEFPSGYSTLTRTFPVISGWALDTDVALDDTLLVVTITDPSLIDATGAVASSILVSSRSVTVNSASSGGSITVNNTSATGSVTVDAHALTLSELPPTFYNTGFAFDSTNSQISNSTIFGSDTLASLGFGNRPDSVEGRDPAGDKAARTNTKGSGTAHPHTASFTPNPHAHTASISGTSHSHGANVNLNAKRIGAIWITKL